MARKKRWVWSKTNKGIATLELSSWKYFYDFVHQEVLEFPDYIWRGHGSASWKLDSTLERKLEKIDAKKRPHLIAQHLNNFKMAARGRRGTNPAKLSVDNEWWSLGQHHGLETPLLDWSSSPFVALYFAFSDPSPTPKGPRAVYVLHKSSATNAGIELINPLMDENQRLVNQSGLFTRSPDNLTLSEVLQNNYHGKDDEITLLKVTIPNREREKCLKTLSKMNINHVTLFPDLYGASVHCNNAREINGY